MMDTLFWMCVFLQIAVGIHLIFPLLLHVFHAAYHRGYILPKVGDLIPEADYAIIVTVYGQTETLHAVLDSILRLHYRNYLVYVVMDNCRDCTLEITDARVVILRPDNVLASNTRSHFYAIERFRRQHERLTIIDSDNLVHPAYLNELNRWFDKGYEAVQGVRKPKNLDTALACLDAARDYYYHYYDSTLLFRVGSSSTLAGSGMAFTTRLYRDCLGQMDIVGAGFDKVLQFEIINKGYRIASAAEAVVYDEKTSKPAQLVNQRARWINTWFKYVRFGFLLMGRGLRRRNFNQFLFGFILVRPPLFMFLLLSLVFMIINVFYDPVVAMLWAGAMFSFIVTFVIALRHAEIDKRVYHALWQIPLFICWQLISLVKAKKANSISVATKHTVVKQITDIETLKAE